MLGRLTSLFAYRQQQRRWSPVVTGGGGESGGESEDGDEDDDGMEETCGLARGGPRISSRAF